MITSSPGERRGAPLNLHNLENRAIKPALEKARWTTETAEQGVKWFGFDGFRRGLASNLFSLGVNPKVISTILRHGDVATAMEFYISVPDSESRSAIEKLEERIKNRPTGVTIGQQNNHQSP
jgi:integrase